MIEEFICPRCGSKWFRTNLLTMIRKCMQCHWVGTWREMEEVYTKGIRERIEEYFVTVTDEQLAADLNKAGYSYYRKIKMLIFSGKETI